MKYEYKGYEISIEIEDRPTAWIVSASIDEVQNGIVVKKLHRIKEEFPRGEGAMNVGMHVQKMSEKKIDDYLAAIDMGNQR